MALYRMIPRVHLSLPSVCSCLLVGSGTVCDDNLSDRTFSIPLAQQRGKHAHRARYGIYKKTWSFFPSFPALLMTNEISSSDTEPVFPSLVVKSFPLPLAG
ncbi:hypothetical protein BDZ85DRAFT_21441 [Elsinoe ampelina]|uniref:Secreted protein n=1 Tax=Elsinoe ampelina TaxID=302913 RepID=A0A6A6G5A1_9PEZI|nr:hypothetical protein BDZ85DRAFT_21441 [Elsinoe ampelina]